MADVTSIPAARVPLLEPGTQVMSREWYRFLFNQFGQTGGGTTDISLSDLALAPFSDAETEATMDLIRADVQGLALAPPQVVTQPRYASYANTAAQTLAGANTATVVTFDTTIQSAGVGLASSSQVKPGQAGTYLVSYGVQIDKTAGGDSQLWLWLRKNGTDLANTARQWRVKGSDGEAGHTLTLTVQLAQTDYLQAMWASDSTNVTLAAVAATAFSPAGPSALLSITQVNP